MSKIAFSLLSPPGDLAAGKTCTRKHVPYHQLFLLSYLSSYCSQSLKDHRSCCRCSVLLLPKNLTSDAFQSKILVAFFIGILCSVAYSIPVRHKELCLCAVLVPSLLIFIYVIYEPPFPSQNDHLCLFILEISWLKSESSLFCCLYVVLVLALVCPLVCCFLNSCEYLTLTLYSQPVDCGS